MEAAHVRRWRDELISLLAAKAPRLDRALKKIARRGDEVVLIDGTLIPPAPHREGEPAELLRQAPLSRPPRPRPDRRERPADLDILFRSLLVLTNVEATTDH